MKLFVDIPNETLDRATEAIRRGGYRSLSDMVLLALENQISQELATRSEITDQQTPLAVSREANRSSFREEPEAASTRGESIQADADAMSRTVSEFGWMWGLVNRVFPMKVAARTLSEMTDGKLVPLEAAKERAADSAAELAASLRARGAGSASRDESLLIGLPARDPLFRAKQRYADHFVGRADGLGRLWGAMFELGLAGAEQGKQTFIGLTEHGRTFARLMNPVLDEGSLSRTLSDEEIEFYKIQIVPRVQRERDCFRVVLNALQQSDLGVGQMDDLAISVLGSSTSADSARSQKAAAIGRMKELGLLQRAQKGRDITFSITSPGRSYLEQWLTEKPGSSAKHDRKVE